MVRSSLSGDNCGYCRAVECGAGCVRREGGARSGACAFRPQSLEYTRRGCDRARRASSRRSAVLTAGLGRSVSRDAALVLRPSLEGRLALVHALAHAPPAKEVAPRRPHPVQCY
ncbi:hypothetical protein JYU34_021168 [Plutella xylostella]|uniref:Uncharacterized protein n=1 Tax=Plutella xylostella TaxID=51655 RepID=A0ABQ7PSX7_PLUXY|nr:hypothetical protein JYU34_021168 [Plutella xylostella]